MTIAKENMEHNIKMNDTNKKIKNKKQEIPKYTSVQACKILGISRPQFYSMIKSGEIIPDDILRKPENSRVTHYLFSEKTLENWKKGQAQYLGVKESAKTIGVCIRTFFLLIYDKKIIPDKVLMNKKKTGKKQEIYKYLFHKKTLQKYTNEQEKWIPSSKACKILGLSRRQLYLRVYSGQLIPDKTQKITKGSRGSFHCFFFLRSTLDNFLKTNTISVKNGNAGALPAESFDETPPSE